MTDAFDSFLDLRRRLYRMLDAGCSDCVRPGADFMPPMDILQDADGLTITVELPGVPRDHIEVELEDNLLVISGRREAADEDEGSRFARRGRPCGRFQRTLALPTSNARELSAALKDGVLTVKVAPQRAV